MCPDLDEDLIEATIRRVAEARAARADTEPSDETELAGDVSGALPEGPAAATSAADLHVVSEPEDEPASFEDENPIEATIRRVAQAKAGFAGAKAATSAAASQSGDDPASFEDEDPIEATIRRVAEAKAARDDLNSAYQSEPSEETPHVLPEISDATTPSADQHVVSPPEDEPASFEDEDPIEATIRRVAEAKASREQEISDQPEVAAAASDTAGGDASFAPHDAQLADARAAIVQDDYASSVASSNSVDADVDSLEDTSGTDVTLRVSDVGSDADDPELDYSSAHEPATTVDTTEVDFRSFQPAEHPVASGDASPHADDLDHDSAFQRAEASPRELTDAVARLEDELVAVKNALRELSLRFDSVLSNAATHPHHELELAAARQGDDDFDDAPQISRMPYSVPPRPAVYRDPSPLTATAEQLVPNAQPAYEAVAEIRPGATSAPPVDSRRGFDLLPRTYRITVEDKKRDVDLVPLHRALLKMDGMKDMSLLSYSNGVAIISLDMTTPLDSDALCTTVSRAMSRDALVEVHNETTMVVKLAEE